MRASFKILVCVLFALLCGTQLCAQKIAVKTNLLGWGAVTPNLAFEMVAGEAVSIEMEAMWHKNPYNFTSRLMCVQPEFRYWLGGRPMVNEFLGVTAIVANYDMVLKDQVRDGNAYGVGVTVGYDLVLGRRWNMEFSGGVGLLYYRQKQYDAVDNGDYFIELPAEPNSEGMKFLPVNVGVSLVYIIK